MSQLFPYVGLYIPKVRTWVPLHSQIWDQAYPNFGSWVYFSYSDYVCIWSWIITIFDPKKNLKIDAFLHV